MKSINWRSSVKKAALGWRQVKAYSSTDFFPSVRAAIPTGLKNLPANLRKGQQEQQFWESSWKKKSEETIKIQDWPCKYFIKTRVLYKDIKMHSNSVKLKKSLVDDTLLLSSVDLI